MVDAMLMQNAVTKSVAKEGSRLSEPSNDRLDRLISMRGFCWRRANNSRSGTMSPKRAPDKSPTPDPVSHPRQKGALQVEGQRHRFRRRPAPAESLHLSGESIDALIDLGQDILASMGVQHPIVPIAPATGEGFERRSKERREIDEGLDRGSRRNLQEVDLLQSARGIANEGDGLVLQLRTPARVWLLTVGQIVESHVRSQRREQAGFYGRRLTPAHVESLTSGDRNRPEQGEHCAQGRDRLPVYPRAHRHEESIQIRHRALPHLLRGTIA